MWPYGRSQDDLTYRWNRQPNNAYFNQFSSRDDSSTGSNLKFGSQPELAAAHDHCWANVTESVNRSDLKSESDSVSLFIDGLCLQNTNVDDQLNDFCSFFEPNSFNNDFTWNQGSLFDDFASLNSSYQVAGQQSLSLLSDKDEIHFAGHTTQGQIADTAECWEDEARNARSAPPSPLPYRRKRSCSSNRNWSDMDMAEQMKVVENLTTIVNTQMDVFEQLEIIRILNPDAKLVRTTNEFIVELSMLDDSKFRHIRDLLRLQGISLVSNQPADCISEHSASGINKARRTKQEIRLSRQKRLLKLRQRKDRLQQAREQRSGLFEHNETMSVKSNPPDEENDIDILS